MKLETFTMLLLVLTSAGLGPGYSSAAARKPTGRTWHFVGGLTITAVPQPRDDTTRLLDARLWKFTYRLSRPKTFLYSVLELREKGQEPQLVGGGGGGSGSNRAAQSLSVGVLPLGGDELAQAKNVRFSFWSGKSIGQYPQANPFKNGFGFEENPKAPEIKDAIPLLSVTFDVAPPKNAKKQSGAGFKQRTVVLVLKAEAQTWEEAIKRGS